MSSSSFGGTVAKMFLVLVNLLFVNLARSLFLLGWQMSNGTIPGDTLFNTLALSAIQFVDKPGFTGDTLSASLLVIGIALSTVSLFGLLAVLARSPSLHTLYTYLLTLWLILLGTIFFCGLLMGDITSSKARAIFSQWMGNFTDSNVDARAAINVWQSTVYCCGLDGPADWYNVSNLGLSPTNFLTHLCPSSTQLYPSSCCGLVTSLNLDNLTTKVPCTREQLLYHEGCFSPSLLSLYKLSFITFFTLLFQFLCLLMAVSCCLKREHCLVSEKARNQKATAHLLACPYGSESPPARLSAVEEAYEANIPPPPYESIVFVENDQA